MTDFDAIAQGMTQAVPFAGFLGLEITNVGEGEATARLPERDELKNHVGSQHAGALFTVAEAASGAAFVGAFAERLGEVTPLARNAEISYERIAKGPIDAKATLGVDKDEAQATLDADGKVVFPCEIVLTDSDSQQVATATVHWHVRLNQPAAGGGGVMARSSRLASVLATVALAVAAFASSAAARNVYVPNYEAETVGVLDATTGQVAASAFPTGTGTGPWTSAVSPDGKTVYVILYDTDFVQGFDTTTNQPVGPQMPVGDEPYGISITPDGKKAYVANTDDDFISVLDLQAKTALAPITVGDEPYEIAISPNGARAYVACDDGISIVDTATAAVAGTIPLDDPSGVAITPDGKFLVAVLGDETTVIVDTATNQVVGTPIPTSNGYIPAIDPAGTRAYVSGLEDSVIYVIDLATRQALTPIALPAVSEPEYLALSPDGKRLFASDYDGEGVYTVDTATNQALGPLVKTGKGTGKMSVVPDQPPTASVALPARIRPGVPATLSGAGSTDADGTIATYAWAFGDGGVATGPASTAAHTYAAPGEYKATLTLTDNEGCSTTFVFTGATANCNGSALATTTQTVLVKYPGVKIKCPKKAGSKGCKFKLKAVKKTGKGKKKKLKAQSAVAKAKVKAGKSAIVSLKPTAKAAATLATAKKTLVQQVVTIDGETTTKVGKLKVVE